MYKELIARLRVGAGIERERVVYIGWGPLATEAADAIEALQAENERIQAELQNSITRRQEQIAAADFAVASLKEENNTLRQQLAEAQAIIEASQNQTPCAFAMRRDDGLVLDVICPDEHESHEGEYTLPLYSTPVIDDYVQRDAWRYRELIFAVARKFPNESRHETALRYIKRMEEPSTTSSAAMKGTA
jgi:multidrug efflux pump subunit AcrA (membrane-fusion protein)